MKKKNEKLLSYIYKKYQLDKQNKKYGQKLNN